MRYTRIFLMALGALALSSGAFSGIAQAQAQLEIFEKELAVFEILSEEEYAAQSDFYEETPFGDKALAYSVRLPSDWTEGKSFGYSLSPHVPVETGKYTGPVKFNKPSSYFVVQAQQLGYRTSAKEWFNSQAWKHGYSVQGAKEHDKNLVEALHVELRDGETYIVRSLTIINGSRLVQALYYLPSSSWEEERVLQNQIVNSFKLLNPEDQSIEAMTRYEFLDVASFEYPSAWDFVPPRERSLDFMSTQLVHYDPYVVAGRRQIVNGRIRLLMFSHFIAKSVDEEMANHMQKLSTEGIVVQGNLETDVTFRLPSDFTSSRVELFDVLDGEYPNRRTELLLVGMESEDYYYVVSLTTPSKEDNFALWTRNMEVLKAVLGSIDPNLSKKKQ